MSGPARIRSVGPLADSDPVRAPLRSETALTGGPRHELGEPAAPHLLARLPVSRPVDREEAEADRVAEAVMAGEPAVVRPTRTRPSAAPAPGGGPTSPGHAPAAGPLNSPGRPLDPATRRAFECRLGHDFGRVRVHAGPAAAASARSLGALAYTVGSDVVLGRDIDTSDRSAQRLLAHELAHVVQQSPAVGPAGGEVPGPGLASAPAAAAGLAMKRDSASPELDRIRDYLSYGLFDWAVTDEEAIAALDLLKRLPRIQQAEFVSDSKYLRRLRENLPAERKLELDAIETDVAGSVPKRADLEAIIDKLSYGIVDWAITDAEAIEALDLLKALPEAQLAVALARIDYGRLMDNLPEDRRKELIDLLAKGLGTGGLRDVSLASEPGVALRSLRFTSDHGVMTDNTKDWNAGGSVYPEPEWLWIGPGESRSAPISHTKDMPVTAELTFDVAPATAPPATIDITGESDVDFLDFSFSGTQQGGAGRRVTLTSTGKVPNEVIAVRGSSITWNVRWGTWEHEVGRTGPFDVFVTISPPVNPAAVTRKRMEKAVELVSSAPSLASHDIVKEIMFRWTTFNLDVRYSNEWDIAADMETGAQCIDLVRFVQSVIGMVGAPGTADAVVVWAQPSTPLVAEERAWPHGGMSSAEVAGLPAHPSWQAALLDGDMRPNNFEAALKFSDSGVTSYYPGGVPAVMSTADEVLRVFNCLAWIEGAGKGEYVIRDVPATYQGGPYPVGSRHRW